MRDPVRLIHSLELASWERELLQSAREETPDSGALHTLLACLPPQALLALDRTPGPGDTQPPSPGPPPSTVTPGALPGGKAALSLKAVLTTGFGVGLAGAFGWATLNANAVPPAAAPRTDPTALRASTQAKLPGIGAAETRSRETTPQGSERATPPAPVQPPPSALSPDTTRPTAAAEPASSLTDEVQILEQVRRAIATGHPTRARTLLAEYRSRFPRGTLAPEAHALEENVQIRRTSPTKSP